MPHTSTNAVGWVHGKIVAGRRAQTLASHLSAMLPSGACVLDIGCGDGSLDRLITNQRADLSIEGIDVLLRKNSHITVKQFDGVAIPYPDASFDAAMLIDVLHHTQDPLAIIREAQRVAKTLVIKDHFGDGLLATTVLRVMDWVGNAPHGVALPYHYLSRSDWASAFASLELEVAEMRTALGLYPWPASLIFDGGLHFIARLENLHVPAAHRFCRSVV